MDPALHELTLQGDPDDEVTVILRLRRPGETPRAARVVSQFGDVATARVPRRALGRLWSESTVTSVKAPRAYSPDLEPEPAGADAEPAEPNDAARPSGVPETGRGVVIGFVDWGLDLAHPDFRHADGSTRLLALWDQRQATPGLAEPYGYGRIFSAAAIDAALREPDPYVALQYDAADFDAGPGAHGTHTCSIAAGNGRGGGPVGMAPEAHLVFVNLGRQHGSGDIPLGHSAELLEALHFIVRTAAGRPCVVNLSLGRHAGEHTGHSLVELAMDQLVTAVPGVALVQSCGNYYQRRTHSAWQLRPGEVRSLHVDVDPQDRTTNQVDLWYPGRDRLLVDVSAGDVSVSEVGGSVQVELGGRGAVTIEGREVARVYHRACDPNNGDNQISIYLEPGPPSAGWDITLTGQDVVDGRVHAWIERDAGCRTCQARFDDDQADPLTTLGSIANGYRTIAVGAYDAHQADRRLGWFSSSGPTRDGRQKPDLVAHGLSVLGARSRPKHSEDGARPAYVRMSGTSMAAPAVTGTVALIFQAAGRLLPIDETRRVLLASCDPPDPADPALRLGSGYLNPRRALAMVRAPDPPELPMRGPFPSADTVEPADTVETADTADTVETVDGANPLRCPAFAGDDDLRAVIGGRLRLAARGTNPYPAPVRSSGPAVRKVQEALVAAGYPLPQHGADGSFGQETGQAVSRFKRDRRIEPSDPVVGPATLRALDETCAGRDLGCLPTTRVAVVGAGLAGLMAAWSLESGGTRVTVFEATGRLGGRVRTDPALVPGKVVEAGAELIGENHPTWIALARQFGLKLVKVSKEKDYDQRGLKVRVRLGLADLSKAELAAIEFKVDDVRRQIAAEAAAVDALQPWRTPGAAALDAMSLARRLDDPKLFGPMSTNARRYFEFIAENDQCAATNRQSYLGYLCAVKAHMLPGDPLAYWRVIETDRCEGGNEQLATHLAKGLRDVRLNSPVTTIEIGSRSVRVGFGSPESHADFDYVVLATAPMVWPKVLAGKPFRPADYTMSHGPAVKFLSVFARPFWQDRKLAPSALWDRLGSVWEGTDKQPGGAGHCLSVYSGGGLVLDPATYAERLEDFYPGYASNPKTTTFVDWPTEPWVRTGYSIPAPGEVTTIAQRLAAPFEGRLFFAGEQASPGFYGYMEGALTSGVLAAYRIGAAVRSACTGATGATGAAGATRATRGSSRSESLAESAPDSLARLDGVLTRRASGAAAPDNDPPWLHHVLGGAGLVPDLLPDLLSAGFSAAKLFDLFAARSGRLPAGLAGSLAVLVRPGSRLVALRPGDLVLSRGRGSPFGSVAVVASGQVRHRGQLLPAGYRADSRLPGLYAHVLDPAPHPWSDRFARRVADQHGMLPPYLLILRSLTDGDPATGDWSAAEGVTGTVKGRCPDVPVPPASRPAVLRQGSTHSAVREIQRKLNAFHAYRIAEGLPGLQDAPLEEDCTYGRHTRLAVRSFQQLVFPGAPAEHDGKVGARTWAALDAVAVGESGVAEVTIEQLWFSGPSSPTPLSWDEVLGLDTGTVEVLATASGLPAATMPDQVAAQLTSRPPNREPGVGTLVAPVAWPVPREGPDPANPARTRYRAAQPVGALGGFLAVRAGLHTMATAVRPGGTSDAEFRRGVGATARGAGTQPSAAGVSTGDETREVPDGRVLIRAGGLEVLELSVPARPNWRVPAPVRRLVRSPADAFYYSGHALASGALGIETTGVACGVHGSYVDWIGPAELAAAWPAVMNLDVLIIAGCSVLAIDLSGATPSGTGVAWTRLLRPRGGPLDALLGYRRRAPCDSPNGDAIARAMAARLKAGSTDYARDWLTVNGDSNANNATAIDARGIWTIAPTTFGGYDIVGPTRLP